MYTEVNGDLIKLAKEGNFDVQQRKIIDDMKFSYENELFPELK